MDPCHSPEALPVYHGGFSEADSDPDSSATFVPP